MITRRSVLVLSVAGAQASCGGGTSSDLTPTQAKITGTIGTWLPSVTVPVSGATVFSQVADRIFETVTDELGNFELKVEADLYRIAINTFYISAFKPGYQPLRIAYPLPNIAGVTYPLPAGQNPSPFLMLSLPTNSFTSYEFSKLVHLGSDVPLQSDRFLVLKSQGLLRRTAVFSWVDALNGRFSTASLYIDWIGVDGTTNSTPGSMWLEDSLGRVIGTPISLNFHGYPGARFPSSWGFALPSTLPVGPVNVVVRTGDNNGVADAMEFSGRYIALS